MGMSDEARREKEKEDAEWADTQDEMREDTHGLMLAAVKAYERAQDKYQWDFVTSIEIKVRRHYDNGAVMETHAYDNIPRVDEDRD